MDRKNILGFFQQITRPALSNAKALELAERLRAEHDTRRVKYQEKRPAKASA